MRKVISIFLSILLLASSTGIAYAQHFCGDYEMIAEVTLGEKHLSCGMVMEVTGCEEEESEDHHCCDNQYTQVNTDDNFSKVSFDFSFQQTFATVLISELVLHPIALYTSHTNIHSEYQPPPLYKDIPVLYETFLI